MKIARKINPIFPLVSPVPQAEASPEVPGSQVAEASVGTTASGAKLAAVRPGLVWLVAARLAANLRGQEGATPVARVGRVARGGRVALNKAAPGKVEAQDRAAEGAGGLALRSPPSACTTRWKQATS